MNELSIIEICHSRVDVLPNFIDSLSKYLMGNPGDIEIIIVTNENHNSLTSVSNFVKECYPWLKFRMLQKNGTSNPIGAMIRFGLAFSTSKYVVLISPYGEDDISIINNMLTLMRKGSQLVQVSRYSNQQDSGTVKVVFRFYQAVYQKLAWLFLGLTSSDFTYGFKMFDRVFVQSVGLTQNTYAISPEVTIKTLLARGKIDYLPSAVMPSLIGGNFKLYKDGPGYLWLLVRGLLHRIGLINWF